MSMADLAGILLQYILALFSCAVIFKMSSFTFSPQLTLRSFSRRVSAQRLAAEDAPPIVRPGKVRANLPQEYDLSRFVELISSPHSSWNVSLPACDWYGVICDKARYVTEMQWRNYKLLGSLRLDFLPRTVLHFNVWDNKLKGTIPFDAMPPHLRSLRVQCNLFTGQPDLSHLPRKLIILDLHTNRFDGTVNISHLPPNLRDLDIHGNNFSGKLDITRLPRKMTYVNFSHNRFTGPLHLHQLPTSLLVLDAKNNLFSGLVKFDGLPVSLRSLSLENNKKLSGEFNKSDLSGDYNFISVGGTGIIELGR